MKVKERLAVYSAMPSPSIMRGRLLDAIEKEEDETFIQNMYVMMLKMRNDIQEDMKVKYSLSELKGILSADATMSYADLRESYLKDKYSL